MYFLYLQHIILQSSSAVILTKHGTLVIEPSNLTTLTASPANVSANLPDIPDLFSYNGC